MEGVSDVEAMASSAVQTAGDVNARAIVCLTATGGLARLLAKYRPDVPVLCYTDSVKVARQLQLHRACFPVLSESGLDYPSTSVPKDSHSPGDSITSAVALGLLKKGEVR